MDKENIVNKQTDDFMMFRTKKVEDLALIAALEEDFDVYKLPQLGDDPQKVINEEKKKRRENFKYDFYQNQYGELKAAESEPLYNAPFHFANHFNDVFLIGCYKNDAHLQWITDKKKYNVRLGNRRGAVKEDDKQVITARFLILYDFEKPSTYSLYRLENRQWVYKIEDMKKLDYPTPKGAKYLLYGLTGEPINLDIDIQQVLESKKVQKGTPLEGAPIYLAGKDLKEYCSTTK